MQDTQTLKAASVAIASLTIIFTNCIEGFSAHRLTKRQKPEMASISLKI